MKFKTKLNAARWPSQPEVEVQFHIEPGIKAGQGSPEEPATVEIDEIRYYYRKLNQKTGKYETKHLDYDNNLEEIDREELYKMAVEFSENNN